MAYSLLKAIVRLGVKVFSVALVTPALVVWSRAMRLFWWHIDLLSASYYAAEFPYSQFNPDAEEVLFLVTKTRGGQQYYQRKETMAWDISHDEVVKNREIVMCNSTHEISLEEAQGRNRSLSVQRKAYAGAFILLLAILLEGVAGVDISILTSGSTDVTVNVPEVDFPVARPE